MTIIDRRYSVAEGQAIKTPCKAATTANITLSGEQTIDGVALTETSPPTRCLVKDQSNQTLNGIYDVSTGNWTRTKDFDGAYDIVKGTAVYVTDGTVNALHTYLVTTVGTIVVGTSLITFAQDRASAAVDSAAAALASQTASAASAVSSAASAAAAAVTAGILTTVQVLNFTRLAVAADHTVVTGDYGKTLDTTVKMVTITFPAAAGFNINYFNAITNSSGRRVNVAVNGYATFSLYPGQMAFVLNTASGWSIDRPARYATNFSGFTLYVNHTVGSDSNDGLAAGSGNALATIQKAINLIENDIDCAGFGPTIQIASETFTENTVVHTFRITGYHVMYIVGDAVTPSNCIWQIGAGFTGLTCRDWSGVILDGVRMVSTGNGSTGVSCSQHGIIDLGNVEFGAFAAGICVQSTNGGSVGYTVGATTKFLGNAAILWSVSAGANLLVSGITINLAAITITTALSITGGVATFAGVSYTGTAANSIVGIKYGISGNGLWISNSCNLPGVSAGTTATGGQAI